MRILFLAYPWLELLSLIQLGINTSALIALGYVLLTVLAGHDPVAGGGALQLSIA